MRLDINAFFPGYRVSPLGEADLAAALALCQSTPLYYRHFGIQPTLENLREHLTALPPGKALEDKFFLGLWQGCLLYTSALVHQIHQPPAGGHAEVVAAGADILLGLQLRGGQLRLAAGAGLCS